MQFYLLLLLVSIASLCNSYNFQSYLDIKSIKSALNEIESSISDNKILFESAISNAAPLSFRSEFSNVISSIQTKEREVLNVLELFQRGISIQQDKFVSLVSETTGLTIPAELQYLFLQGGFISLLVLVGAPIYSHLNDKSAFSETPYDVGSTSYDVSKAEKFYNERPLLVISRLMQLALLTSAFNIKLLLDWRFDNLEKNQKQRAKEALVLSTQLGPTFIKLGQALSIRTDLIPEAYALELRQLQDAVPPFDSVEAKEIIRREMKINNLDEIFSKLSTAPIASASIGQVYRGTLIDGRDVAVKVQRPNILSEIALDLYLLRLLTPVQVKVQNFVNKLETSQSDIDVALSLVDEWGRGFVAEVDYRTEAINTKQFSAAMKRRGLDAVTAPAVIDELSDKRVITTEWMEGTRLDRDASPDVPRLCSVAINAYLTMLLDTGTLHCDPHPGNLFFAVSSLRLLHDTNTLAVSLSPSLVRYYYYSLS